MNGRINKQEDEVSAQPLTRGHESFHSRLERIERNHSRQAAGGRAASRMYRRPVGTRSGGRGRVVNTVPTRSRPAQVQKLSMISRLKCWSFGCLIGGVLTLGSAAFVNVDALFGFVGFSAELLYSAIWVAYLFFFVVAALGLFAFRQKPAYGQFSLALATTMVLGLL